MHNPHACAHALTFTMHVHISIAFIQALIGAFA